MFIPTALLFSRYRAFLEPTQLTIAPLTIVIGRNGGGKSVLTRLALLIAAGLSRDADAPLDLEAGGIEHAARFEDVIYGRSAHPFSIGAEISDGTRKLRFNTTLLHMLESHSLAIESFELFDGSERLLALKAVEPEDIGRSEGKFVAKLGGDVEQLTSLHVVGLFPVRIDGKDEFSQQLKEIRSLFESAFASPAYLGPFRTEQGASAHIPRQGVRNLGPRGERALDVVGDDRLRWDGKLATAVEDWFEKAMGGNRVKLQLSGDLARMLVHDPLRNIDINIGETGAGFAQIFPIVVQSFAARAGRLKTKLLIVEQPELHLHPGAHGAIADLLIETVKQQPGTVSCICETHSEQFITRVRRRIAEGMIDAKDVLIASVGHQSEPEEELEPLRMISFTDSGNPLAWPIGVFDEAFEDLIHLREAGERRTPENDEVES